MIWSLDNAEERERRIPDTFIIPSEKLRCSLREGDYAKLLVVFSKPRTALTGESMWVKVTRVNGCNYEGEFTDKSTVLKSIKIGDQVAFLSHHIMSIRPGEKHGYEEKSNQACQTESCKEADGREAITEEEDSQEKGVGSSDFVALS